ncbi:uncharacterized protein GGS22DRAFT_191032 [Annulohypoxylon maeteangense]|uniref:uncharacterized protein n=1 Tax=Annulohypoxylon maeteangense TaxID=1927788 RepID=UPI002008748B|nr:uncharacterized protein GGS22DRAFT_191032 [Annulohypoxylon maeteangense]KAI0882445.1 hypothetical protein GGS22DRAFT_191032 [Annulohypoxylon maeteangense]
MFTRCAAEELGMFEGRSVYPGIIGYTLCCTTLHVLVQTVARLSTTAPDRYYPINGLRLYAVGETANDFRVPDFRLTPSGNIRLWRR